MLLVLKVVSRPWQAAEKQVLHQLKPQSLGDGPVTLTFYSASLVASARFSAAC
jgi:hypothetical protein